MRIIAAILFISVSAMALTQYECTDVDLRSQLGEVRNQGDVGWCYANATADLLTAFIGTKNVGVMSAIQMAMIYNYSYEPSLMTQGGVMHQTLKTALRPVIGYENSFELLKFGFCPNSMETKAIQVGRKISLMSKIKLLNELKEMYDTGKRDPVMNRKFWDTYLLYKSEGSILNDIPEAYFLNALEKSTPANFLLRAADLVCGEDRRYMSKQTDPKKEINVINHHDHVPGTYTDGRGNSCDVKIDADIISEIHREISKRSNVVGISFYINLIERGGTNKREGTGHAATVVGRKWRENSCQFLVRNSWGTVCDETINGKKVSRYSSFVRGCEGGNIWVSEAELKKSLTNITYLQYGPDAFVQRLPDKLPDSCVMKPIGHH